MSVRRAIGLVALVILLGAGPAPAGAREASLEYPVKAAFLYKFGSFVIWPASAFPGPNAPLVVCVVGRDPFGALLDRTVRGQTIDGRPVVVRRFGTAQAGEPCNIAFLGGSREQSVEAAAAALAGSPVLTVSEGPAAGSAIQFLVIDNRVRFVIDQRVADAAGLSISSKLLNLAVAVNR